MTAPIKIFIEEPLIGDIDSSNKIFTTSFPYVQGSSKVAVNGVKQELTTDYTETDNFSSITFVQAPFHDDFHTDSLKVEYMKIYVS